MNNLWELLNTSSPERDGNIRIHINKSDNTIIVLMDEVPIILFEFLMNENEFIQINIGNVVGGDITCKMNITQHLLTGMTIQKLCDNINLEITNSIEENKALGNLFKTSWVVNYNINNMKFS